MKQQNNYWIAGLIGAVCFGVGDWLIGFVDPKQIANTYMFYVRAGHGAPFALWRVYVAVILFLFGICFGMPAFLHSSDIVKDTRLRGLFRFSLVVLGAFWLIFHLLLAGNVTILHQKALEGDIALNAPFFRQLQIGNSVCRYPAYVCIFVPLFLLSALIVLEHTVLRKMAVCFSPLVWTFILFTAAQEFPASAFSYGLYTFSLDGGMLVWFIYLLTRKTPTKAESHLNGKER